MKLYGDIYWLKSGKINELIYCKPLSQFLPFATVSRQTLCVVGRKWAWRFTQASHAANSFSVLEEAELLMGSFHIFWLSGFRYSTEIGNMWHVVSYALVVL